MTSRPLYVPQVAQARCGRCFEPHCWHDASVGGATFHCALRRRVRDRAQRASLLVDFTPIPGSRIGELEARFDAVLGATPADPDEPERSDAAPGSYSPSSACCA